MSKVTAYRLFCIAAMIVADYLFFALLSREMNPVNWPTWAFWTGLILAFSWVALVLTAEDQTRLRMPSVRLLDQETLAKIIQNIQGWGVLRKKWQWAAASGPAPCNFCPFL